MEIRYASQFFSVITQSYPWILTLLLIFSAPFLGWIPALVRALINGAVKKVPFQIESLVEYRNSY